MNIKELHIESAKSSGNDLENTNLENQEEILRLRRERIIEAMDCYGDDPEKIEAYLTKRSVA